MMAGRTALQDGILMTDLKWDTKFFGFSCAKLELLHRVAEEDFLNALESTKQYDFVYICNHGSNIYNNLLIGKHTLAYLADTNVQLIKNVSQSNRQPDVAARNNFPRNEGLEAIARNVFTSSRFFRDERLACAGGSEIYAQWVKNAFNKDDKYFLVDESDGIARGFILFSEESRNLRLELIGVAKSAQASGVGSGLWRCLEAEAAIRKKKNIIVGTQITNINALSFYIKHGCSLLSCSQIFHMWKTDSEEA